MSNNFLTNFLKKIKLKKNNDWKILYSWFRNIDINNINDENFKFDTNIKIVWNKLFYLSDKNDFFINNINKATKVLEYKDIIEKYLNNDLINFNNFFNLYSESWTKNLYIWKKKIKTNIKFSNKKERWNTIKLDWFEYKNWKKSKVIIYLFDNNNLNEWIIKFKKNKKIFTENDTILRRNSLFWWKNLIWNYNEELRDFSFLFWLPIIDLNLYSLEIFLKEYLFFIYYSIFASFFNSNSKFNKLLKSIIVNVNNMKFELKDDVELRTIFKKIINNSSISNFFYWINHWTIWSFDSTLMYCFLEKQNKFYNFLPFVKNITENDNEIYIEFWFKIFDTSIWFSHNFLTRLFSLYLNEKSFLYNTIMNNDFWFINKNLNFFPYENINKIKKILELQSILV